jgi:hypothetical protein
MNDLYNKIIRQNVADGEAHDMEEEDFEEEME